MIQKHLAPLSCTRPLEEIHADYFIGLVAAVAQDIIKPLLSNPGGTTTIWQSGEALQTVTGKVKGVDFIVYLEAGQTGLYKGSYQISIEVEVPSLKKKVPMNGTVAFEDDPMVEFRSMCENMIKYGVFKVSPSSSPNPV